MASHLHPFYLKTITSQYKLSPLFSSCWGPRQHAAAMSEYSCTEYSVGPSGLGHVIQYQSSHSVQCRHLAAAFSSCTTLADIFTVLEASLTVIRALHTGSLHILNLFFNFQRWLPVLPPQLSTLPPWPAKSPPIRWEVSMLSEARLRST